MLRLVKGMDDAADLRSWLHEQPVVAVDTETTGLDVYDPDFRVRLTQFGTGDAAWVVPTEGWEGLVAELVHDYRGRFLLHNAAYDVSALRQVGVEIPWHAVDDTMVAIRLAEPHLSASLKEASRRHTSARSALAQKDLHKAMRVNRWTWATVPIDFEPYVYYAALDVILTYRLAESDACQRGFQSPMYPLEMDLRAICTEMEAGGMRVDLAFCAETNERLLDDIETKLEWATDTHGVSLTSTQELTRWLMTEGVTIKKRTAGGSPSADRESLEMVLADHPRGAVAEVVTAALRVRDLTKLSSTYLSNFVEMNRNGLVHPSINTLRAKTGRMSISSPALQTLPRGDNPDAKMIRRAVIPRREGEVLVACDYEQIELRLIAAFSKDPGLIEAFRLADNGGDVDFFTAASRDVYEDPAMEKADPRRSAVKALFYASSYGAGVAKMAETAGLAVDEMRETQRRVFAKYPGVKALQKDIERRAKANDNWITTPAGRAIWIDPEASYKALNGLIQGFAADLFKQAMVRLGHAGLSEFMVVPIHDEILFSIPEDILGDVSPLIEQSMTDSFGGVALPAEPSDGYKTWSDIPK